MQPRGPYESQVAMSPQAETQPVRPPYLPHLDGVRAVAVLLVLAAHMPHMAGSPVGDLLWRAGQASRAGMFGVELFFVLSGFLITRLLLSERVETGRIQLGTFYNRRAFRIFPIYYLCVAVVAFAFPTSLPVLTSLVSYTFNYYHALHPAPYPLEHAWSLAVEEQFYLLWPLAMALVPVRLGRRVTLFVLPGLAILAAIAFAAFLPAETAGALIYKSLPTRMLSLSLGAAIAFRERAGERAASRHTLETILAGLVLLVGAAGGRSAGLVPAGGWYWCIVLPGSALVCYAVIAHLVLAPGGSRLKAGLAIAPLRFVGRISYGIYLYHLAVLYALGINEAALPEGGASPPLVLLALVLTLAIAAFSFRYIEQPLLRLRDRWQAARVRPVGLASALPGLPARSLAPGR